MNNRRKVVQKGVALLSCLLLVCGVVACGNTKTDIEQNADKYGYSIEFIDDKNFYIEEDDAKYCYSIGAFGVKFDECEIPVAEEGVEVTEGETTITIKKESNGKVRVGVHDTRVVINDEGEELDRFMINYFIVNKSFDASTIKSKEIIDPEGKALNAYNRTMDFLTMDELRNYYDRAQAICGQLNS